MSTLSSLMKGVTCN